MQSNLIRPIVGINMRSAQEVFDIMVRRIEATLSAAEPVSSIVPDHCSGTALVFQGGCLHVRKDGSGHIVVDEDDFKLEDDRCEGEHGSEGSVHWIARFPAGEMTALRNFLNGQDFPAPPAPSSARPQCCMCGKKGLSTVEGDGGTECELSDGRWVCSSECYDRAVEPAPSVAVKALLDGVWNAAIEKAAEIANDCVHLTPDPGAAIKTVLNGRAKLHPLSDAAISAQVQDVAEVSPGDYMRRHDAAIAAYEANTPHDYRYSALALRKAVDAAFAVAAAPAEQVQDVAGWQSQVTHEDICNTHEGGPCNCDWSAADEYQAHPDDIAVDRFAAVMKAKLTKKRDEGRGGWEDKDECSQIFLSQLLREHVEKGDPVDVGNLAMMLHQRGERIASLLEALQGE